MDFWIKLNFNTVLGVFVTMKNKSQVHSWKFVQNGGLIQAQISTIDDILNLDGL